MKCKLVSSILCIVLMVTTMSLPLSTVISGQVNSDFAVIENGEYPVFTEKDRAGLWGENSWLSYFMMLFGQNWPLYSYGFQEISEEHNSYATFDDFSRYPSIITEDTEIYLRSADIFGGEEVEYVRLFDPMDEAGNFIGSTAYENATLQKEFLSWEKFEEILFKVFTGETGKVITNSDLFINIDGYACIMILPKSITATFKPCFSESYLVYQKDNIAYVLSKVRRDEYDMHVYKYDTASSTWQMDYSSYFYNSGLFDTTGHLENYSKIQFKKPIFNYLRESGGFKNLVEEAMTSDKETLSYTFDNEPTLTTEEIDTLLYDDGLDFIFEMIYSPTDYFSIEKGAIPEPVSRADRPGEVTYHPLYVYYEDGIYKGYRSDLIKHGYQKWEDWKDYLLKFYSDEQVAFLESFIVVSDEGYVCGYNDYDGGPVAGYISMYDYEVLTVKDGYAYLRRYSKYLEEPDPNFTEGAEETRNALCILEYDETSATWKIVYNPARDLWGNNFYNLTGASSSTTATKVEKANEYIADSNRKATADTYISFGTPEYVYTQIDVIIGEELPVIPDTSDSNNMFYTISVFTIIILTTVILKKRSIQK